MNVLSYYRRAVNLGRSTSRLSNMDWYESAGDLDIQLHLYLDKSEEVRAYLFYKREDRYVSYSILEKSELKNPESISQIVEDIRNKPEHKKIKSLGIVLMIADELGFASLGPEHEEAEEFDELRELIMFQPSEVLNDKTVSVDTHSWRLFPYYGAVAGSETATTVVLTRKYHEVMELFRNTGNDINFPVITAALSAPLCAVAALPYFANSREEGSIIIYNYQQSTLLAFFNSDGELMLLRNMQHPYGKEFPTSIGSAMTTTANAFELENPEINILPLCDNNVDGLISIVQDTMPQSDIMLIDQKEILKLNGLDPDIPLETMVATQPLEKLESSLLNSQTFQAFINGKWHLQEFILPLKEEVSQYPDLSEMKLLKASKLLKTVTGLLLIVTLIISGFGIWKRVLSDEWRHESKNLGALMAGYQKQIREHKYITSILKDRSKAWVGMEFVARLMPETDLAEISNIDYSVELGEEKANKKSISRLWAITGYTTEDGLVYLESLSKPENVERAFLETADISENEAYLTNVKTRSFTSEVLTSPNTRPNKSKYPLTFTLKVVQNYASGDDNSMILTK